MLRQANHYCSTCLRTRKFVSLTDRLVCQFCSKRLWRVQPQPCSREEHDRGDHDARPKVRRLHLDAVV